MPVLAALVLVGSVLVLVGSAVACPAIALVRGDSPRWRLLRVTCFALAYLVGEIVSMALCLGLWVASGFGWRLRSAWCVRAHRGLLRCFLGAVVAIARPLFGFRLVVDEPSRHPQDVLRAKAPAPLLVLARHAGPGASFALVHLLISRYGRAAQVVLTDRLRLDPAVDLLLTRTGCTWIPSGAGRGEEGVRRIGAAAAGLSAGQALVLFPEGADWTPVRHLRAVARLRGRGRLAEARRALRMPHVLPPRPAGTLAALRAAPDADVLIFTHTGHDALLDAASAWAALPLRSPLHMMWWREAGEDVPDTDERAASAWLQQTWEHIDAWIGEQQQLTAVRASAASARRAPA